MNADTPELRPATRPKKGHGLFTGLLIITVGLALLADRMGYGSFPHFARQWPLLLIAMGAYKLWSRGPLSLGAQAILFTGVYFELRHLGYYLTSSFWWPSLVIWIGLMLTLRALRPASASAE